MGFFKKMMIQPGKKLKKVAGILFYVDFFIIVSAMIGGIITGCTYVFCGYSSYVPMGLGIIFGSIVAAVILFFLSWIAYLVIASFADMSENTARIADNINK